MCGLTGCIFRNDDPKYKDAFQNLLYLDMLRGDDATGVAFIGDPESDDRDIRIIKDIVLPHELMNLKEFEEAMDRRRPILGFIIVYESIKVC